MDWRLIVIISAVTYCEFLADYIKLGQCSWSKNADVSGKDGLKAMILSDTHLLGPRGHWLDKLYREWHMQRAFRAGVQLLNPDVIFILGDLFDEGDFVNNAQFAEYIDRFHRTFPSNGAPIVSAVGNHDVGFHYKMHPYFTNRFEKYFNNTSVNLYTFKDIHFVFINSMAMEDDGCDLCDSAIQELHKISAQLECVKNPQKCDDMEALHKLRHYSRPIVMQHFPTYRLSDAVCREHDAPTIEIFRENWEVLSKESTRTLGKLLHPRLAFSGHIHHYCWSINQWRVDEYSVASFSWRNKVSPSFLLATLTTSKHAVVKCDMLEQQHVYIVYCLTVLFVSLLLIQRIWSKCKRLKSGYTRLNWSKING